MAHITREVPKTKLPKAQIELLNNNNNGTVAFGGLEVTHRTRKRGRDRREIHIITAHGRKLNLEEMSDIAHGILKNKEQQLRFRVVTHSLFGNIPFIKTRKLTTKTTNRWYYDGNIPRHESQFTTWGRNIRHGIRNISIVALVGIILTNLPNEKTSSHNISPSDSSNKNTTTITYRPYETFPPLDYNHLATLAPTNLSGVQDKKTPTPTQHK